MKLSQAAAFPVGSCGFFVSFRARDFMGSVSAGRLTRKTVSRPAISVSRLVCRSVVPVRGGSAALSRVRLFRAANSLAPSAGSGRRVLFCPASPSRWRGALLSCLPAACPTERRFTLRNVRMFVKNKEKLNKVWSSKKKRNFAPLAGIVRRWQKEKTPGVVRKRLAQTFSFLLN